jgi:hypothetical protein
MTYEKSTRKLLRTVVGAMKNNYSQDEQIRISYYYQLLHLMGCSRADKG